MEEIKKDMTPILLQDLGMRFTSETKKYKARYGLYQCQYCGNDFETQIQSIKKREYKVMWMFNNSNTWVKKS